MNKTKTNKKANTSESNSIVFGVIFMVLYIIMGA